MTNAEYMRLRHARQAAQGICAWCNKRRRAKGVLCRPCRIKSRRNNARRSTCNTVS